MHCSFEACHTSLAVDVHAGQPIAPTTDYQRSTVFARWSKLPHQPRQAPPRTSFVTSSCPFNNLAASLPAICQVSAAVNAMAQQQEIRKLLHEGINLPLRLRKSLILCSDNCSTTLSLRTAVQQDSRIHIHTLAFLGSRTIFRPLLFVASLATAAFTTALGALAAFIAFRCVGQPRGVGQPGGYGVGQSTAYICFSITRVPRFHRVFFSCLRG